MRLHVVPKSHVLVYVLITSLLLFCVNSLMLGVSVYQSVQLSILVLQKRLGLVVRKDDFIAREQQRHPSRYPAKGTGWHVGTSKISDQPADHSL